ncbi:MAG: XRE family transcriptional regulator [Eikenella sp.]|nr:XRE family transcriptional regulator [Eikenella sp.]
MNAEKIYQELSRKGYNASIIAEAIGVLPQSVAVVIRTGKGSKRIATAIAAALDKKLADVFPFYEEKENKKLKRQQKAALLQEKISRLEVA